MHPSAEPVLYICPADGMNGQLVYNLRNNKIQIVDDVTIVTDSRGCSLLLARSNLLRPAGTIHSPETPTPTYPTSTASSTGCPTPTTPSSNTTMPSASP